MEGLPRFHPPWSGFLAFAAHTPLHAEVHRGLSSDVGRAVREFSASVISFIAITISFLQFMSVASKLVLTVILLNFELHAARHFFADRRIRTPV